MAFDSFFFLKISFLLSHFLLSRHRSALKGHIFISQCYISETESHSVEREHSFLWDSLFFLKTLLLKLLWVLQFWFSLSNFLPPSSLRNFMRLLGTMVFSQKPEQLGVYVQDWPWAQTDFRSQLCQFVWTQVCKLISLNPSSIIYKMEIIMLWKSVIVI